MLTDVFITEEDRQDMKTPSHVSSSFTWSTAGWMCTLRRCLTSVLLGVTLVFLFVLFLSSGGLGHVLLDGLV